MVLIFGACRQQQANTSLPSPTATRCRLISSLSAKGLGTGMLSAVCSDHPCYQIKRRGGAFAVSSLTAHHCRHFSGAPRAVENSTHLLKFIQKALVARSSATPLPLLSGHIRGGPLRRSELHLLSHQAGNPSQGLPAAHASLKSIPLDAVKTIRGATSPHINPGCIIILQQPGRTATAKPGSHVLAYLLHHRRSPPLLQPDFHRQRTKVSCCSGHSRTHRLSGSLRSLHGHVACPEVLPLGTATTASRSTGSINILPPDSTLSSNCFASNPDQTQCLPKLRYKCQHEAQQHKHILHAQQRQGEFVCFCSPPPCIYNILFSAQGRKQQNSWEFSYHHYSNSDKVARNTG